eukprot:jgi/Ulvmu1/6887/UM031_0093.1
MNADVADVIAKVVATAWGIYNQYKARKRDQDAFARFMKQTAGVLEALHGSNRMPQHAQPIVQALLEDLQIAEAKVKRYTDRGIGNAVLRMGGERARLTELMRRVELRLPLLQICVSSPTDIPDDIRHLQNRIGMLQGDSAAAAAHRRHITAMLDFLAQHGASAAQHSMQAIEELVHELNKSTRALAQLHDGTVEKVLDGCLEMHQHLGAGVAQVLHELRVAARQCENMEALLGELQEGQGEVLSGQRWIAEQVGDVHGKVGRVEGLLQQFLARFMDCDASADAARSARSTQALQGLRGVDALVATTGEPPDRQAEAMAAAMRDAIHRGRLQLSACLVLGVPLMSRGPLRPVTLSCCGLFVSHAGAQHCEAARKCALCNTAQPPLWKDNEAVAAVVRAEESGLMHMPQLLEQREITLKEEIASGGEGTAYFGALWGLQVAVKRQKLGKQVTTAQEVAEVRQVVMASYLAGNASPHVCRMHGYCWTERDPKELWLVTELCNGTLVDLVTHASQSPYRTPGLPLMDVITLGLMMCSALAAVHDVARCLHLDVKPANVLVRLPAAGLPGHWPAAHEAARAVRGAVAMLTDFGMARQLPHHIAAQLLQTESGGSEPQDVAGADGTPGYASPEQVLDKLARRRSDVWSLGALLGYAITGKQPFGVHGGDYSSYRQLLERAHRGSPHEARMTILDDITDPDLRKLLSDMTALKASDRPELKHVEEYLRCLYEACTAAGDVPRFLAPLSGISPSHQQPSLAPAPALCPTCGPAVHSSDTGDLGGSCMSHDSSIPVAGGAPLDVAGRSGTLSPTSSAQTAAQPAARLPLATVVMNVGSPDSMQGVVESAGVPGMAGMHYGESLQWVEEVAQWLSGHGTGDVLCMEGSSVRLCCDRQSRHFGRHSANMVSALGAHDWLPWRTQMIIEETVVVRVSCGGGEVQQARIQLGRTGLLILDGSCQVKFARTEFEGGTIVCKGPRCQLALEKCSLQGCILVVLDGAQVTISRTNVCELGNAVQCYAITARGHSTRVDAERMRIDAWSGVLVEQGAAFHCRKLALENVSCTAVHARGRGTVLSTTECKMTARNQRNPSAFQVAHRARVADCESVLSGFDDGMHAEEGAKVTMTRTQILGCAKRGVFADNARVELDGVDIQYAHEKGIVAAGVRGEVIARGCKVVQPMTATYVIRGASVEMDGCMLKESLRGGLLVDGPGSKADLVDCGLEANAEVGVRVSGGARVALRRCRSRPGPQSLSRDHGACYVVQAGSELSMDTVDCQIPAQARVVGCVVEAGGRLDAKRLAMSGGEVGLLFLQGSVGALHVCHVKACAGNGLEVLQGAAVEAHACTFKWCQASGVLVCGERRCTLAERTRQPLPPLCGGCQWGAGACAGGDGAHAWSAAGEHDHRVRCEECTFAGNAGYGVLVMGPRTVITRDPSFSSNGLGSSQRCAAVQAM